MTAKRINVGVLESVHRLATQASGIAVQDLQDFVTDAAKEKAERVIADFQSGKAVRHSRRDNARNVN